MLSDQYIFTTKSTFTQLQLIPQSSDAGWMHYKYKLSQSFDYYTLLKLIKHYYVYSIV